MIQTQTQYLYDVIQVVITQNFPKEIIININQSPSTYNLKECGYGE